MILRNRLRSTVVSALITAVFALTQAQAQTAVGGIHGQVADPSGAVIPNASVAVTTPQGRMAGSATSNATGAYSVRGLSAGTYSVDISAPGFASFHADHVTLLAGQMKNLNAALDIAVAQQQVQVQASTQHIDTSADNNANQIDLKGKALDALSDDPDELEDELQALAGPAAGPNGGQIYIDGFTGGQMPPKSSIREIRINQNPFSAEYDRLGYGRIEIFTKPGTDKLHGEIHARGNYSAFNAQNPLLNANLQPGQTSNLSEPSYYSYDLFGNIGGPLGKNKSYFINAFTRQNQYQSIIDATNPTPNADGTFSTLNEAVATPTSRYDFSPRIDLQLGQSNTLTVRYDFYRAVTTDSNVGQTTLPEQGYTTHNMENTLQVSDSLILSKNLVDDIRFQYRNIRDQQEAQYNTPSVSVQGAFTTGGNNSQTTEDHQDDFELQNYFSGSVGTHSLNFGARLRAYRDDNFTDGGSNGSYTFSSLSAYQAGTPQQYSYTLINNPTARATLFDSALFYQDDWKINNRFTFSYGVRWEAQNFIHDKNDWAPRISFAYALDGKGNKPAKTVLRAGYGWFYQRFTVANGNGGTPYVIQAIHENYDPTGTPNEQQFIDDTPGFFDPSTPVKISSVGTGANAPTFYSVDPHFHASNDMEAAIGVDRQLAKRITSNVTYLYTQGVHQYFTNNIGAISNANVNPTTGSYTGAVTEPAENNLQYQSEGIYREHQIIATMNARYRHFSVFSYYAYSNAKADTDGVTYVPSVASNPGLDYGRAGFDVHNRFFMMGNFQLPWQVSLAPMLYAASGTPFNITTGTDLTGNNQFNARPTYAASCTEANTVVTKYGCLDADPVGTNERIVPYDLGTGPINVGLNLRLSKVIGFGPKVQGGGPGGGGHGGGGFHGLTGNNGGPGRLDASVPRKYNLTFMVFGSNLLNTDNRGTPNGTIGLTSTNCSSGQPLVTSSTGAAECPQQFFLKSQSLAGGFFGPSTSGNRSLFLETRFNF